MSKREGNEFVLHGLRPREISRELDCLIKEADKKVIRIKTWCKSCGICVAVCPKKAIEIDPKTKKVELVRPDDCIRCGICEKICPDFAILITGLERKNL
ncbi:MAG: 4Fe-4S binding protein [Armatimonadota bacterium]